MHPVRKKRPTDAPHPGGMRHDPHRKGLRFGVYRADCGAPKELFGDNVGDREVLAKEFSQFNAREVEHCTVQVFVRVR